MSGASVRLVVLSDLVDLASARRAMDLLLAALPVTSDVELVLAPTHAPTATDGERARELAMSLGHELMRITGMSISQAGSFARDDRDIVLEVGDAETTHRSTVAALRRLALHAPGQANVVLRCTTV